MTLEKQRDEWYEGYLNNVWCKFKTFVSPDGDLFVVAKRDSTIRVFRLKKKIVDAHKGDELNDVMNFAEEVSKIPSSFRKEFLKKRTKLLLARNQINQYFGLLSLCNV